MLTAALAAAIALSAGSAAADITVSAFVDRTTVGVDQPVTLTVQVEGTMQSVPAPSLPPLDDSWVVRASGTSSNMSWVNGQVSISKSWNYTLLPRRAGTLSIGAAEVEFGDSVYRTEPIEVEVVEGTPRAGGVEERPSPGVDADGRDVFIVTSVDRETAFQGEQITLSFKFYRRVSLWDQPQYGAPDLAGFWVQEIGEHAEYNENVNGIRYRVIEIKTALFGTAPGPKTIGPATLTYRRERPGFTFFSTGSQPVALRTEPIEVEILPLPAEGRPDDFGGAVGTYSIKTALESGNVPELEPVTLTVTVSGTGNVRTVPEPALPELPDFKVYESGTSTDTTTNNDVVGGVKRYEYVLVPQSSGSKTIPGLVITFFDPSERAYRRSETRDIGLEVTPGTTDAEQAELPVRAAISRLGRDIRYIREPEGVLRPAADPIHTRTSFLLLQALPLVALIGVVAVKRRRDRFAADSGLARHVRAPSEARKALKAARVHLAGGDSAAACSAIARAVTDFIGNRWNIQAWGMTIKEIESTLERTGADPDTVARVRELLSACDFGRFAAGEEAVQGERLLDEAEACIGSLARLSVRRRR
jgi:hypothetical protein